MLAAIAAGLELVKFFPARSLGGPSALAAYSGPFPSLTFMPSGGVELADLPDYLALPTVAAVSGGWMTPNGASPEEISELASKWLAILKGIWQ